MNMAKESEGGEILCNRAFLTGKFDRSLESRSRSGNSIDKEVELDAIALSDLELIATGAYSPLNWGFSGRRTIGPWWTGCDWRTVRAGLAADHASCPG